MSLTTDLQDELLRAGASVVGVCDVKELGFLRTHRVRLLEGHRSAISIAVELAVDVFSRIVDRPTSEYSRSCSDANARLADLSSRALSFMEASGHLGHAIPPSGLAMQLELRAALSHKAAAYFAGIGWIGKNSLVIHERFGPRIRLVTVLTNAVLTPGTPSTGGCGACELCARACPANAIRPGVASGAPLERGARFDFEKCASFMMREFSALPGVDAYKCGLCIKACPYGRPAAHRHPPGMPRRSPSELPPGETPERN